AVAQVVMNRVFSGYYPGDVCGVVYQNAHRHLACQFTFACDGIPDVVTETEAWERATRVAKATLDGKIWLPEIGKATHYHAYWVHPWWVRTMRKLTRIGVHSFYRPRRWGDGDDAPRWGSAPAAPEAAAKRCAVVACRAQNRSGLAVPGGCRPLAPAPASWLIGFPAAKPARSCPETVRSWGDRDRVPRRAATLPPVR